ncbi:hypothetical protein N9414_02361 [Nodularia spumigena CCY9414]|nr:hypothetical protein N9414_02361 [Nodularia spumigena CCY9414]
MVKGVELSLIAFLFQPSQRNPRRFGNIEMLIFF